MNTAQTPMLDPFKAFPKIPQITAAMVGISAQEWHFAKPEEAAHEVQARMERYGFDVMPVQEADGATRHYWRTVVAGDFKEVVRCGVNVATDCLYLDTDLLKLTKKLDATRQKKVQLPDGREAFQAATLFLTAAKSKTSPIVGLVADSNLHSRPVFLRSFALLSELESQLSRLLRLSYPGTGQQRAEHLREAYEALPSETKTKTPATELLNYQEADDNDPVEYLSLATLLRLIEGIGYASWLGYDGANKKFSNARKALTNWRNYVYHPTRPYRGGNLEEKRASNRLARPTRSWPRCCWLRAS